MLKLKICLKAIKREPKYFIKIILLLLSFTACVVGFIFGLIAPQYIENNIKSQRNSIMKDISKNIEITKTQDTVYLSDITKELDPKSGKVKNEYYHWTNWQLDTEYLFFDKSKKYVAGNKYKCNIYDFDYSVEGTHRVVSVEYCVLDNNGKNSNGEVFDFEKCRKESIETLTEMTIETKIDDFSYSDPSLSMIIASCIFLCPLFGIAVGVFCFYNIPTYFRHIKNNYKFEYEKYSYHEEI